jgi:hypothetical protein
MSALAPDARLAHSRQIEGHSSGFGRKRRRDMGTPITTTISSTQDRRTYTPARIGSPDDGDTRFTTPCFFVGFPDDANVGFRMIELIADDNTPYACFWVDLRNGPLVIEVPPNVLCLMNDRCYRWVADLGITGPAQQTAGGTCCCRPITRARCLEATTSCSPKRRATSSSGAASKWMAISNSGQTW